MALARALSLGLSLSRAHRLSVLEQVRWTAAQWRCRLPSGRTSGPGSSADRNTRVQVQNQNPHRREFSSKQLHWECSRQASLAWYGWRARDVASGEHELSFYQEAAEVTLRAKACALWHHGVLWAPSDLVNPHSLLAGRGCIPQVGPYQPPSQPNPGLPLTLLAGPHADPARCGSYPAYAEAGAHAHPSRPCLQGVHRLSAPQCPSPALWTPSLPSACTRMSQSWSHTAQGPCSLPSPTVLCKVAPHPCVTWEAISQQCSIPIRGLRQGF